MWDHNGSVGRAKPGLGYGGGGPDDFSVVNAEADAYKRRAQEAQQRGVQNVEYGADRQQAGLGEHSARGQQAAALQMAALAAQGGAPSQANMLGNQQQQQSFAAMRAGAAGAQPGNMAMAQMGAMGGAAQQQAQIAAATMQARSGELQQARGLYGQGAAGLAGADMNAQAMHAQQLQYEAQLRQQERAQNDAYSVQNYGAGINLNNFAQDANNAYWKQKQDYETGQRTAGAAEALQAAQHAGEATAAAGGAMSAAVGRGQSSDAMGDGDASATSDERTKYGVRRAKPGDVAALLQALKGARHG